MLPFATRFATGLSILPGNHGLIRGGVKPLANSLDNLTSII